MSALCCPSCGGSSLSDRGQIPDAHQFAGTRVDRPLPGGHLYRCADCHLHFRYPRLAQAVIDHWYRQASPGEWAAPLSSRVDCGIAIRWIQSVTGTGKVLDIGCHRGDLLAALGPGYRSFGIEINGSAADIARARGVEVIGRDFSDLGAHEGSFDVITAIDVIEHVPDPLAMLGAIQRVLRPGGVAILSTGNASAWSWRMMGSRYWYCSIAEHIAFIDPSWCRRAADRLGLKVERLQLFAYAKRSMGHVFSDFIKNLTYYCAPRLTAWMRRRLKAKDGAAGQSPEDHPPSWTTARDHVIVLFRKPVEVGAAS